MPARPLLLLLACLATGCVGESYRQGMDHVDQGDFVAATKTWLHVLEDDQFEPGALKGLERWSEAAHDQLLDQARLHEAEGRYEESLATYDALMALDLELQGVAALGMAERPLVAAERQDAESSWAKALLEQGAADLAAERFESSVAAYTKALALRPALTQAEKPLGDAYLGWAHQARESHDYRSAVERYDAAMAHGAGRAAKLWSAAVHVALGEHFYEQRACRAAARELRLAGSYLEDMDTAEKLALAEDCARVELVIQPFESLPELSVAGTAPGAMLADKLEAILRDEASEFLFLLDPKAPTTLEALGGGLAGQRPGTLYEVRGRITQLAIERPAVSEQDKTIAATTSVLCPLPEGVYYRTDEWCEESVSVTYTERLERILAQGAGSVRVVQPRNGEQLLTQPIEAGVEHQRAQVTDFHRMIDGEEAAVKLAEQPADGVLAVPIELLDARKPPPPLPSESQLATDLANALARAAADAILGVVDATPEVEDPQRLTIPQPMFSASDVTLQGGTITSEPSKLPELPAPAPQVSPDNTPVPELAPTRAIIPGSSGGDEAQ